MNDPLNPPASPGQIETLVRTLERTENLKNHFDLTNAYDLLTGISTKQCRYLNALIINKKYFDLNKFLEGRGFTKI